MTNEPRWSIRSESEIGSTTTSIDPMQPYGRRRRVEATPSRLTVTVESELDAWRARYEIGIVDGRPTIRGIRVEPVDDSTPPTKPPSRELWKTEVALEMARAQLPDHGETRLGLHGVTSLKAQRPRRKPDYFYAVIASMYEDAHMSDSPDPTKIVAERLKGHREASTVPNVVLDTRKRGMLSPADGNRPGGTMTDLGRQVLFDGPPDGYDGPELPM